MNDDSRVRAERNCVDKEKSLNKKKRKDVQEKRLINAPCKVM